MANRHHHKKQRARVRASMAETGESYQQALTRIRTQKQERAHHLPSHIDLLCIDYFGTELTLATFQILERLACVVVPSSRLCRSASPGPRSPLLALDGQRIVH
ncbi:MAG TPA: hypothetical protein VHM25_07750 [Polyangiaceae bacterium]|jgi:ribosome recycling factor|nr:hypothetical protein [Polyangiaceae bacterium]